MIISFPTFLLCYAALFFAAGAVFAYAHWGLREFFAWRRARKMWRY